MPVQWLRWAELRITKCGSNLIYETLPGKEVVYVLQITSILGRPPVVRAGDTGTIPLSYSNGFSNGAHRCDHALAKADTSAGAGVGCPMYFENSWALGWSRNCEVKWSSVCDLYYILLLPINVSLLHIITWPVVTYYCYFVITLI